MKTKSLVLVIVTLIIGFVLGMLTSAQIRSHKLKPVKVFFSEERFREGFYKIIQPDEEQKAVIEQVLNKYAKINGTLQNNFRKDLDESMKAFRKELDSKLTREQIARLKEMEEKRLEMIRENRKKRESDSVGTKYDRGYDRRRYRDHLHIPSHSDSTGSPGNK